MPLIVLAGIVGLVLPAPLRTAVDHNAINLVLAFLVLASGMAVPTGAGKQLRAGAGRLAIVITLSTITIGVAAWAVSHLVTDQVLAHGVLALGVAPTEIATIALTALAGGAVAVTATLLTTSTLVSVLIAGPVLAVEAGRSVDATERAHRSRPGRRHPDDRRLGESEVCCSIGRHRRGFGAAVDPRGRHVGCPRREPGPPHVRLCDGRSRAHTVHRGLDGRGLGALALAPGEEAVAILLSTSIRDFAIASGIATSAFGSNAAGPLGLYGMLVIGWGALLARAQRGRVGRP